MARRIARGEIWMYRFASPDKRRPVLVISHPVLLEVLSTATVAAISTKIYGAMTEVLLDESDGMKKPCAANLANVHTVRQSDLRQWVSTLRPEKMRQACRALLIAAGCDAG